MLRRTVCVLLSLMLILFLAGCSGGDRQKGERPFDLYTELTTKDDIESLSDEPFIEGVFSFTLMTFQRPGYENHMFGQLALLAVPSFEGLEMSPYWDLIRSDPAAMQDPERHPILVSSQLAKAEGLSVGDAFSQETGLSDGPMTFTVAGIFRQETLFAQFEAVALINDQITRIFSDKVDELGYTNAYLKASDPSALKAYMDEDFIPHLQLKGMSEEEIADIPEDVLKAYYEEYDAHMIRMK